MSGAGAASRGSREPGPPGRVARLLLAPLVAWAIAFAVLPTAMLVACSFGRRGTLGGVEPGFSLAAWGRLLDPTVRVVLGRSVAWAGLATIACLVLAVPAAWTIARSAPRRRAWLLAAVVVPFWTSFLVRAYAWVTILKGEGLLNGALLAAGLVSAPIEMLYTPGAVLLGLVHTFLPFAILPVYATAEALDPALVEAASDLGAGPVRTFREVVLPLLGPGIAAAALLVFVPALGLYALNDVLGGGRVDMIGNLVADQFTGAARDWPFGAALSVALLLAFAVAWRLAGRGGSLAASLER
ncbi:ABC transporter permease [bacterium]|nr:ABC transporter permease [bacterium]